MEFLGRAGFGRTTFAAAGAATAILLAGGCAHVNQDDMDRELDQIRVEMREGDEAVAQELHARADDIETRISSLEQELVALETEFGATVERMEAAIRFNAPVHFAFDDDAVRAADQEILDRFSDIVHAYYEDAVITVEGFADPAGDPQYNLALGERRAESVMDHLVRRGLSADRLRAVSYGDVEDRQVVLGARGPGEEGWQNRRVAMVIDFNSSEPSRPDVVQGEGGF